MRGFLEFLEFTGLDCGASGLHGTDWVGPMAWRLERRAQGFWNSFRLKGLWDSGPNLGLKILEALSYHQASTRNPKPWVWG